LQQRKSGRPQGQRSLAKIGKTEIANTSFVTPLHPHGTPGVRQLPSPPHDSAGNAAQRPGGGGLLKGPEHLCVVKPEWSSGVLVDKHHGNAVRGPIFAITPGAYFPRQTLSDFLRSH
jgi:hypothetical protein